jgi:hypothetical protein
VGRGKPVRLGSRYFAAILAQLRLSHRAVEGPQGPQCHALAFQALLGHDKLETTARYTRVATGMIANHCKPAGPAAAAAAQELQKKAATKSPATE